MAKISNYIGYGALADRPAAGAPGALYFTSDTNQAFRDSGTGWDEVAAGGVPLLYATTLVAPAASISITPIYGVYSALELHVEGRSDVADINDNLALRINGDAGANYDWERFDAYGTTPDADQHFAANQMWIAIIPGAMAPDGPTGGARCTLPNYAGTTFHKRVQSTAGGKFGTSTDQLSVYGISGWWRNAAAVAGLELTCQYGNFITGTTARLYGIR